ncbi:probable RNA-binding protein EIF1AD [Teleopsis dalmanni]|uniref:probable RNA-binding protein EIF1AD n=1 Tax=Teleopsis dalmanni TaxID=139649 RepID=UPI0018CF9EF7|nr:probable RNA-binding protein EIF1AD [Teleopsis dalmanni]
MSRVVRRKHVLKEMMDDNLDLPEERQQIVRVVCSRGNNLHEVEAPEPTSENFLVSMPTKFRKNVWVKRGDLLLVNPIDEGSKVRAEICKILTQEHVKEFTKAGVWPKRFTNKRPCDNDDGIDSNACAQQDGANGDDDLMVPNLNRPQIYEDSDETEESDHDI